MNRLTNIEPYWNLVERIIKESDLVLEVLDARLIELSRNEKVEELIFKVGRPFIFVVNKSDLVDKKQLKEQVSRLRDKGECVFISSKNNKSIKILLQAIKKVFKKHGKREATVRGRFEPKPLYREALADIVIGVLGYPNVGKSSLINALSHKKKVKVSKKAGTTHGLHWVRATDEIKLIDSPGVIPLSKEDEIRYGLIGARDSERLKNPELVAHAIIKLFFKHNKKSLEVFYGLTIDEFDCDIIVKNIGLKKNFLLKGGAVDENRTCIMIIRDWQQGQLRL